ncbi:MAG TPA: beta-ketoacyl-ACP reductase [Gammaproteobacteria bacterium]|nr:beta-ketoacyl-ACP reductase [Gammaproteobacteria bacterium]
MKIDLTGKVALVTGGTGGIGDAICRELADVGCRVATNYRNEEKARKWAQQCQDDGYDIPAYKSDVSDFKACEELVKTVESEIGPIDILVNNAGITKDVTLRKMTFEQWSAVININLNSVFNLTRHVIEGMTSRGFGRVINISSINGQKGQMGQSNYAASKAGMHGFTMSVAQEVARKGVTVNTVSPGYIATEMVMAVPEDVRNKIIATIPAGRLGEPEEVAHMVTFLVSEQAAFINGADISINGGQHMC